MLKMYSSLHPGETIKELWLGPMGVSRKTLFKIVNGRGRVTPEIARRLSCGLGRECGKLVGTSSRLRSVGG